MFNLIMLINLKARSIWLTHDPLFQSIGNIYITASFGVPHVSKGWGARGSRRSSSKWLRCRAFGEGKGTRKGRFFFWPNKSLHEQRKMPDACDRDEKSPI